MIEILFKRTYNISINTIGKRREILVPSEIFLKKWKGSNDESSDKIERIAKNFRCSRLDRNFVLALARSAAEGRTQYAEIYRLLLCEKMFVIVWGKFGFVEGELCQLLYCGGIIIGQRDCNF